MSEDVKWCEFTRGADGRWYCQHCDGPAMITTMRTPTIVRECKGHGTTRAPKVNGCKNCGYDYSKDSDVA